jgi:hypothetical protein
MSRLLGQDNEKRKLPGALGGNTVTVKQAVGILDLYCSAQDPVILDGMEMQAGDLEYYLRDDNQQVASQVYITYWKKGAKKCRGTLQGMVMDRMKH